MPKAVQQTTTSKKTNAPSDPCLVALDNHKRATTTWRNAWPALEEAELEAEHKHGERPDGDELAGKEWDERAGLTALRREHDRASAAELRAAWKLAETEPTTVAGAAAVLAYITAEPAVGLFDLGETAWHETAFRTVAAALANITAQGKRAAA
jgi:hypothetical protein